MMRPAMKPRLAHVCYWLTPCASLMGGCFSTYNTSGPRNRQVQALTADAWPRPKTDDLYATMEATPREVRSVELAPGSTATLPEPEYVVEHKSIECGGLLRVWTEPGRRTDIDP